MEFGYNSKTDFTDYLQLEDIYNVGLEAIDSDGFCYYLLITTTAGNYSALEWGPVFIDDDIWAEEMSIKYSEGKSKDKYIAALITKFLGPKKRTKTAKEFSTDKTNNYAKITEVNNLGVVEVLNYKIDLFEYISTK